MSIGGGITEILCALGVEEHLAAVEHGDRETADVRAAVRALPGVEQTPAARDERIIVVDALEMLGFGPRIGTAVARLADGAYRR